MKNVYIVQCYVETVISYAFTSWNISNPTCLLTAYIVTEY